MQVIFNVSLKLISIPMFDLLDTYLTLQFSKENFNVTTAMHPSTYLNKILFGSREGAMQLWNIKTRYVACCYVY